MLKKSVLSVLTIFSLLAITGFITASSICEGRGVHGVEIGGECFDCNSTDSDGICPDYFSDVPVCTEETDIDCGPVELDGWWSTKSSGTAISGNDKSHPLVIDLITGEKLYLVVVNTELPNGENITFNIWERDTGPDDNLGSVNGTVSGGTAIGKFHIKEISDLNEKDLEGKPKKENKEGDILDLYFEAYHEGSKIKTSGSLFINATYGGGIEGKDCGIYDNPTDCGNDNLNQGGVENYRSPTDDCTYVSYTVCNWHETACLNDLGSETILEGTEEDCTTARDGTCSYTSGPTIGNCAAGDDFFKATYVLVGNTAECDATWTSNSIPCAQQLKVPFFGFYSFIASIFAIGLIYLFLRRQ